MAFSELILMKYLINYPQWAYNPDFHSVFVVETPGDACPDYLNDLTWIWNYDILKFERESKVFDADSRLRPLELLLKYVF